MGRQPPDTDTYFDGGDYNALSPAERTACISGLSDMMERT
jgi:hypothetical protein